MGSVLRTASAPTLAAACLVGLSLLLLVLARPAVAAPGPSKVRVETLVKSNAPDARKVHETYVRVFDPLPESAPPHPKSCDWIGYLRFRNPKGPKQPKRAAAVVVAIPGFLGGAGSFDQLARNVVRNAAARKRNVEFWALDRRANCLEDRTGVVGEARTGDPRVGFDYYFGGKEVDGKRFGGFTSREDAEFLNGFGLERTLRDWYRVLQRIPGQRRRARKVICGGHSLGGPLTAAFASWDFDGDPATVKDAGYKQCAGLFGLDTTLELGGGGGGGEASLGGEATGLVAASGASPYVDAPPLTPRTIQLLSLIGPVAFQAPGAESIINKLIPNTPEFEFTLRALYSKNAVAFATGQPSTRDIRLTNAVVLGGVLDDNSAGISILRSSLGFVTGGQLADKNFPAPDPTLAIPDEPNGPLYRWLGYNQVGAPGAPPLMPNDSGQPYTNRESEVSSLRQLARAMFEAPANLVEQYFPTRILTDVAAAGGGSGGFDNLQYDGPSLRPALLIQAGDSDSNAPADDGPPMAGKPPNGDPLSREVILPGYNHLDVVTAARRQNDGQPEGSSRALTNFTLKVVPKKRKRKRAQ